MNSLKLAFVFGSAAELFVFYLIMVTITVSYFGSALFYFLLQNVLGPRGERQHISFEK